MPNRCLWCEMAIDTGEMLHGNCRFEIVKNPDDCIELILRRERRRVSEAITRYAAEDLPKLLEEVRA